MLAICVHGIKPNFSRQSETKDWVNKYNFSEEICTKFKNFCLSNWLKKTLPFNFKNI